jgi:hypothetical protein
MGTQIDIDPLADALEGQRQGYHVGINLGNWIAGNTSLPTVAGYIEVGGALYFFNDESPTGTPADGDIYIKIEPSGATATATLTTTEPTWSYLKGGWYGTGAEVGHRYLPVIIAKSGSNYTNKREFFLRNNKAVIVSLEGSLELPGSATVGVDLDVTGSATVGVDLDVTGSATVGVDLDVTGDITAATIVPTTLGTRAYMTDTISADSSIVIPAGIYFVAYSTTNIKLQIKDSGGTWRDFNYPGFVFSDGINVRLLNIDLFTSQPYSYIKIAG